MVSTLNYNSSGLYIFHLAIVIYIKSIQLCFPNLSLKLLLSGFRIQLCDAQPFTKAIVVVRYKAIARHI